MRVHPAAAHPRRAFLVVLLLTGITWGLTQLAPGLMVLLLSLMLWGSLASFFLPTTYGLCEEGLRVQLGPFQHLYPWRRFRRVVRDRNGLLLSPFTRSHSLESFRGLFLPLHPEQAARLAPLLEERL